MTNEIAVQQHSEQRGPLTPERSPAVAQLMEFSDVLEIASRFAETLSRTSMAGVNYRGKPQEALGAILYGAELGLNPVQSLQQVFTVHGTPAIYARTMVALVMRHGYRIRTESSTDESVTVVGTAPDGRSEPSTWTIERATKAGYVPVIDEKTGKYRTNSNGKLDGNMKYLTDPQAMLYAKAAAEVCRKLAPDVLLGIANTAEELESEPPSNAPVRVVSERVAATAADLIGETATPPPETGGQVGDAPAAAPAAEPDKAPVRAAERKATKSQLTRLWTLMSQLDMTDKDSSLAWISDIVKRPEGDDLESTKDLTATEIQSVFRELEAAMAKRPAPAPATNTDGEQGTLTEGGDQ